MLIQRRKPSAYRTWGPLFACTALLLVLLTVKYQADHGGSVQRITSVLFGLTPPPPATHQTAPRELLVVTLLPSGDLKFGETNLTAEAILRLFATRPDRAACDVRVVAHRDQPFDRVLALSSQLRKLGYRSVLLGLPDDDTGPSLYATNAPAPAATP